MVFSSALFLSAEYARKVSTTFCSILSPDYDTDSTDDSVGRRLNTLQCKKILNMARCSKSRKLQILFATVELFKL